MLVICPDCWQELNTTPAVCPKCGARVDFYSRDYERRLLFLLPRSDAETRAQICWVLGSRGKRSSVPALIELLTDPDALVRVAALRGLGEIGDASAVNAVEKLTGNKDPVVQAIAKKVLKMLIPASGAGHPRPA